MISHDTIKVFLEQLRAKHDNIASADILIEFQKEEPVLAAYLILTFSNTTVFSNPVIAASIACSMYRHLLEQQKISKDLTG